jgi:RHS repeat-associated protein
LLGNRFLFTGREYLAELGLYDYRNRMYSQVLGRFLQTDPIGLGAGDVNLYRYVQNGVPQGVDPLGLATIEAFAQDTWQNVWSTVANWIRKLLGIDGQIAAAGHYLRVWGNTSDGCKFYAYGKDSAQGRYTYVPPIAGYHLNVSGPIVGYKTVPKSQCSDCRVECITYTSEFSMFLGFSYEGFNFSISLGGSTINLTICADGSS